MVCRAAVKIQLFEANSVKEITIPCHRHCDAFQILHDFGYIKNIDYKEIEQGFLDEHDRFMNRIEAWWEAKNCDQFTQAYKNELAQEYYHPATPRRLFSEDVW